MSSLNGTRDAFPVCDAVIVINRWFAAALGSFAVIAAATGISAGAPAAADPGFACPAAYGLLVQITAGDIDCITAADFAVQYDQYGDAFQVIGPFTCYAGNAMTAPLLYQCVSEGPPAEFAVYPA